MVEQTNELDELAALVMDDPQRANLREALWAICPGCINHIGRDCGCRSCDKGYYRRIWDGQPKGALAGALLFAVYGTPWEGAVDNADPQNNTDDPDFAILSAVLSALKAKA